MKTNLNVEGIHVINKNGKFNTVTDKNGEFIITVKLNDTILFSSLLHKVTNIIITSNLIKKERIVIELDEKINELKEVFVNTFSGHLLSDIKKIKTYRLLNPSDFGISMSKKKKLTHSERALYTAGEIKPKTFFGLLINRGLNLNTIINGISGKTKKLKHRVYLESKIRIMENIKNNLSDIFFGFHNLEKSKRYDFFYFCQESDDFLERCENNTDKKILIFLEEKLVLYKNRWN